MNSIKRPTMNTKKRFKSAALLAASVSLLIAAMPAQAQESETQALRRQIEELQARLDRIEAAQAAQGEAAKNTPSVTTKLPVVISGLLQVQSLNFFNQDGPGRDAADTFRLRRGELRLTGTITPKLTGTIMIDPAKTTSGTNIRTRDNILQEIQASYLLRSTGTGAEASNLYFDAGQYKIPVGYESLLSTSALPFVERALIFTQRDPFDGGYGDVRDTGLQLRGNVGSQFNYRLGVFNGFGDRQNTLAVSDAKAVLGLLSFSPRGLPGFQIGVSGGRGNTGQSTGIIPTVGRSNRDLFNVFGVYKREKLTLQAEYLSGKAQGFQSTGTPPVVSPQQRDLKGYYGSIGYLFSPNVEGLFRYDYLDANRQATGDSTVRDLILGINYYIKGNNAKIQTNLIRRSGANGLTPGSNPTTDIVKDRTELRTMLQLAF